MHYFPQMSMETILWHMSYANIVMLMSSIPTYDSKDAKDKKEHSGMEIDDLSELRSLI